MAATTRLDSADRRWRGMQREERDAQRRRRLLDAGLEAFGTSGYAAAPIEGLCASAGVATRSFYDLFGSREALLRAIYDEIIEAIARDMTAVFASDGQVRTQIRAAVTTYLSPLLADERKGRLTQLEAVGVGELEAHRRVVIRRFADLIAGQLERWMQAGKIPVFELGLLPLILAGGVSEALVDHLLQAPAQRPAADDLIAEVTRVWLQVLGVG